MKIPSQTRPRPNRGVTLIEMSLVLLVLSILIAMTTFGGGAIAEWRTGREASETLRNVYIAQRTYLADNPTVSLDSLDEATLQPYLPFNPNSFPKVKGLDGTMRSIDVKVSPPVVKDGTSGTYDPSGDPNDSLWDVGE